MTARHAALAAALGCALVVMVCTAPVWLDPRATVWGADVADTLGLVWTLWHVAEHIASHGTLGLESELAGFPDGGALWPANPIEATLAAPLTLLLGAATTYNLLQVAHSALAGGLMAWFISQRGHTPVTALICGLSFGLGPVLLCSAHNGNIEVGQLYWLPLVALAAVRAQRGPAAAALAGLLTGLALIAHVYVGIMATAVTTAEVLRGPGSLRARGVRLGTAGAVAAVVAVPVLLLALRLTESDGALVYKPDDIIDHMRLIEGQTPLLRLLLPWPVQARTPHGQPGPFLNAASPGLVVLGLALVGLAQRRQADPERINSDAVLAMAGALLAVGPTLVLWSEPVALGGRLIPLPYLLLDQLPPFDRLIELWRFGAVLHFALLAAGARALDALSPRARPLVAAAFVVEILLLNPGPRAFQTTPLPHAALTAVATIPEPGPVLALPLRHHLWPLYAQTVHRQETALSPDRLTDPVMGAIDGDHDATWADLADRARDRGYRWVLVVPQRHHTLDLSAFAGSDALVAEEEGAALLDLRGTWPTAPLPDFEAPLMESED